MAFQVHSCAALWARACKSRGPEPSSSIGKSFGSVNTSFRASTALTDAALKVGEGLFVEPHKVNLFGALCKMICAAGQEKQIEKDSEVSEQCGL